MFETLRPPYDLAVFDPPWHFDTWSSAGDEKSPQAKYDTMSTAEIAAMPVGPLLKRDGVLVMWTTWSSLARGDMHQVLNAWGFTGRTGGVWVRRGRNGAVRVGTGKVWRGCSEPIFICTRTGRRGVPFRSTTARNLIETMAESAVDGLAREHSRKPDEVYDLLTSLTPGARRVDIFSRQSRPGWDTWGRERTKFDKR